MDRLERSQITGAAVFLALSALASAACSTASPDGTRLAGADSATGIKVPSNGKKEGDSSTPAPADGDTSNPGAQPSSPSTPAPPAGSDTQCAGTANIDACFACCESAHTKGADVAYGAFDTCACQTPGVCATACGTNYCDPNSQAAPSAACIQCLDGAAQCAQAAQAACDAEPDCKALDACVESSTCEQKPQ